MSRFPSPRVHDRASSLSPRRGATVVEMAVAAPIFFLVIFGLVEFSRMAMAQHALANVAREGARRAALARTSDAEEVKSWVRQQLVPVISAATEPETVEVTLAPSSLQAIPSGTQISVSISVPFSKISWLPPQYLGDVTLQATSTSRRE